MERYVARGKCSLHRSFFLLKVSPLGTSLAVQWLRPHLPMRGTWVLSQVRELRSHMLRSAARSFKNKLLKKVSPLSL